MQRWYPGDPVHDFHYARFIADPLGEVRALYAFMGETLTLDVEAQRRVALDAQRALRAQVGQHRYSLAEFGLSETDLPAIFEDYIEQFGIVRDRDRAV